MPHTYFISCYQASHNATSCNQQLEVLNTMIVGGIDIVSRQIVRNLLNASHQQQPCGVDLTLRCISKWTTPATIDFDNTHRHAARTSVIPFCSRTNTVTLQPGAYLVDFNETVKIPTNCMGSVFPRSSLWRSGVGVQAGVVDAGYEGAMGALLEVKNPCGVILYRDAKLAQLVLEQMEREVVGYNGVYQSSTTSVGVDGAKQI
jgi:dUTP pyrophosphatase